MKIWIEGEGGEGRGRIGKHATVVATWAINLHLVSLVKNSGKPLKHNFDYSKLLELFINNATTPLIELNERNNSTAVEHFYSCPHPDPPFFFESALFKSVRIAVNWHPTSFHFFFWTITTKITTKTASVGHMYCFNLSLNSPSCLVIIREAAQVLFFGSLWIRFHKFWACSLLPTVQNFWVYRKNRPNFSRGRLL